MSVPWLDPALLTGDLDSPDALREAGAQVSACAVWLLAEYALGSQNAGVQAAAKAIQEWMRTDGGQWDDLAAELGLRPKRGPTFPQIKRIAERDAILDQIIRLPRWNGRSSREVAKAIRREMDDYEARGWLRDRAARERPQGELRVLLWGILKLGLYYPLPSVTDMAAEISKARA